MVAMMLLTGNFSVVARVLQTGCWVIMRQLVGCC